MSTSGDTSIVPPAVFPTSWSLANLQEHLGGISPQRIRLYPPPGMATEADAVRLDDHDDCICELVDGVLVEKVMGFYESILANLLGYFLNEHLATKNLGIVSGADGQIRILPSKIRVPDLAFFGWDRFPNSSLPEDRICQVAPDLVVEILSKGNTPQEMEQKLDEYFEASVRLVWYIDPRTRTASIYTARQQMTSIDASGTLEGCDVLPGFQLRLGELFERADRRQA